MTDVIDRAKHIRIVIRLKMRLKQSLSVKVYLILICIDKLCLRIGCYCLNHLKKCPRRKLIIMIA